MDEFCLEVLMWNPAVFPLNPEQNSVGYDVKLYNDSNTDNEVASFQAGAGQTYLVLVTSDEGASNTYDLSVELAVNQ